MEKIIVYRDNSSSANIEQLPISRGWMDDTPDKHAYKCFPLSITNGLGWGISFPVDISFIWDGITDTTPDHVKVLSGSQYCYTSRGNATVSFTTGLTIKTEENTTSLIMPVPNLFVRGSQCFTTLISTSFYKSSIPIAWIITEPNTIITIPANTPIATLVPISLQKVSEYEMEVIDGRLPQEHYNQLANYGESIRIVNEEGGWANLYRDAVDECGNRVGNHELKALKLITKRKGKDDA